MPRIDSLNTGIRSGSESSAFHAGGIGDEVEEVEDAPALGEANSTADMISRQGFSSKEISEALGGSGTVRR